MCVSGTTSECDLEAPPGEPTRHDGGPHLPQTFVQYPDSFLSLSHLCGPCAEYGPDEILEVCVVTQNESTVGRP